jgi:uncharacterized protein YdhG (YjbR/CyaY superfamily)
MTKAKPKDIDEYIAGFPESTQKILEQIRSVIKETAPGADETISYGTPTFNLKGHYLIYFAGYKKHIGLYPVPGGKSAFTKDFSKYKTSGKGTIQFPLDEPLPTALIKKIVKFRVAENNQRIKKKK